VTHGEPVAGALPAQGRVDAAAVVRRLRDTHEQLVTAGPPPGRAWCAAWTAAVDQALVALSGPAVRRFPRFSVVAIGGYGRSELCPGSDVDVLLVHEGLEPPQLEAIVREVIYPLWDAGLTVGYAVRDRPAAIAAIDDLETATALLDLRAVSGDRSLASRLRTDVAYRLQRRRHRFLRALTAADGARRHRVGDAAEVLDPDLKNGAGGLRDVQSLRWAAAALVGETGIDPLVPAGYVAAPDRRRLVRAYDLLLAVRVGLHLVAADREEPGKNEQLRLDLHDPVAGRCGYADGDAHELAPHRLLTDLYLAARTVDHAHRRAWSLIDADMARGRRRMRRPTESELDGFELVDGVLRLPEVTPRARRGDPELVDAMDAPDLPVRLFATLAETGAVLDRRSAARLRTRVSRFIDDDADHPWLWTDATRRRFCETLWRGEPAVTAIAELDDVGLLTLLIPEWTRVRGRPQRNPFHRYGLDRHAWHTAAALGDLVRREPWATAALEQVGDRDGLILGALLHDVGKAYGEPHSLTGIPVAQSVARRLGAQDPTVELVGRMVRLHLLLPATARTRDVTDLALAREVADAVGDPAMLAALHLLAAADGRATGPTAWTDWTAQLVATLVRKVGAVFEGPVVIPAPTEPTAEALALALRLGVEPDAVRAHLERSSPRYRAAVSPRAIVRHTSMAGTRPGPTEVRTRVTPGEPGPPDSDPDNELASLAELDVVAIDHPGWFAKVAGVVAIHGGSIMAADVFSRDDGLAVDTFRVRPPDRVGGAWWAGVEADLADAAAGRLAMRARVARRARTQRRRSERRPSVETSVTTATDPSGASTILEVRTRDRLGVLYAIATSLAELNVHIVVARSQTLGTEVVDAFYLRDAEGRPLDEDHEAEVKLAITSALEER
jgi:[protein-PII] uridylyltransferase